MTGEENYVTCPACEGVGTVSVASENEEMRIVLCPRCEGVGSVPAASAKRPKIKGQRFVLPRTNIKEPPRPRSQGGGHSGRSAMPTPFHPEAPVRQLQETPSPETSRHEVAIHRGDGVPPPANRGLPRRPTDPEGAEEPVSHEEEPETVPLEEPSAPPVEINTEVVLDEIAQGFPSAAETDVTLPDEFALGVTLEAPGEPLSVEPGQGYGFDVHVEAGPTFDLTSEALVAEPSFDMLPGTTVDPFASPNCRFPIDDFDAFDPFNGNDPFLEDPLFGP